MIGKKIFYIVSLLMLVSLISLGIFSSKINYNSTINMVEKNFIETAQIAADRVSWEIKAYSNIAAELGTVAKLSNEKTKEEDKRVILDNRTQRYGLQRCNILDKNGDGLDGQNYSDRQYFQEALKGNNYVSSPVISKITGKITIIVAAPLWKDGLAGTESIGCVYIVPDEEFLNNIVRDINVSDNSWAYIIDKTGATIASKDSDVITNGENQTSDENNSTISEIHQKMISGKNGFEICKLNNKESYKIKSQFNTTASIKTNKRFVGYCPIEGTDGWSLAICAPSVDFVYGTNEGIFYTVIIVIIALTISIFVSVRLGTSIGKSVRLCTERIEKLAEGDLTSEVPTIDIQDERGRLSAAAHTVVESLNNMISDIRRILGAMSDGDLSVDTSLGDKYYVGDYGALLQYVRNINSRLKDTVLQIDNASDQVMSGSEQVSSGAQALSQGATEQAAEIEQLASRISSVTNEIEENSENCVSANMKVTETVGHMKTAISEMSRLSSAMDSISETSSHIENIVKTIEDIAFQTNILALNAAVEASRAGEAGKGFAVVADEVRNLASKSADAAKDTTALIQQSMVAVQNGTQITESTSTALSNVEKCTSDVEEIVKKIALASGNQASTIEHIKVSVDQISSVVQTNSATAEQSAAASQELSGQASMLRELIGIFKL